MDFDYKNILIWGYGRSAKAVENVLKDIGANYKIHDKKIKLDGGMFISNLNRKKLLNFDLIVLSPGVSIYDKKIKLAERLGVKIISELEFGFWFTSAEIIAVTGTNGKTTTTSLINDVMSLAGYKVGAYGNIGNPLSSAYKKDLDYIVCEVSSFQLESTDKFVARIGVLLNISQDHIDRHKTFKNYIDCKKGLFKNCTNNNYAIIGNNSVNCDNIACDIAGNILRLDNSNKNIVLKDNAVFINNEMICEINKRLLEYTFIDNIYAVILVMYILNIDINLINKIELPDKKEHKVEMFLTHNGVKYINDSKATNPDAVKQAIKTISGNIVLLLGGYEKKICFKEFVEWLPRNVVDVVVFGEIGKRLVKELKHKNIKCQYFKTLDKAIDYSMSIVLKGDTLLFSPGSSSFDEFKNYEERGKFFKEKVLSRLNIDGQNQE